MTRRKPLTIKQLALILHEVAPQLTQEAIAHYLETYPNYIWQVFNSEGRRWQHGP